MGSPQATYTFITVVHDGRIPAGVPWLDWLRSQLASSHVDLAADEELRCDGELLGFQRALEVESARQAFERPAWLSPQGPPWIGAPAGCLSWTHCVSDTLALSRLVPRLIDLGRGAVVRADDGRLRVPVREREFSLADICRRHGFEDGDALLSREDDAYLWDALGRIRAALAAAGFDGHVGLKPTHHNPLVLAGELRRGEAVVSDPERALRDHAVRLWTYDWSTLSDVDGFWLD